MRRRQKAASTPCVRGRCSTSLCIDRTRQGLRDRHDRDRCRRYSYTIPIAKNAASAVLKNGQTRFEIPYEKAASSTPSFPSGGSRVRVPFPAPTFSRVALVTKPGDEPGLFARPSGDYLSFWQLSKASRNIGSPVLGGLRHEYGLAGASPAQIRIRYCCPTGQGWTSGRI